MMSGSQFLKALHRVAYPGAVDSDGQSFDWMFENESIVPFLEWFSDSINSTNVLQDKELEEFTFLASEEQGILDGQQLDDALHNVTSHDAEEFSEDRLQEEVSKLTEELEACQLRKECLVQQRNKLSLHHASLSDRLSKMDAVETSAKQEYKHQLEQAQADNTKVNGAVESLMQAVGDLSKLYRDTASGTTTKGQRSNSPVFLSQLDLMDYYRAEEKFSQELTAFGRKQFFEGIAEIAEAESGSRYEFLEVSNPLSLFVKGEREEVMLEDCKTLARLQAIYPKSKSRRIRSQIHENSTAAECQFADDRLKSLEQHPYPKDVGSLSIRAKDAENNLSLVQRDVLLMVDKEIPALIIDAAALQIAQILRGDYNLKIARQDYLIGNHDKLKTQLLSQRARWEMLIMACEREDHAHRDTHRLLLSASMMLQKHFNGLKDRKVMTDELEQAPAKYKRSTIDSRDKFVTRLYNLIDSDEKGDQHQLFLTYAGLKQNAERLNHNLSSLRASLSSTNSNQDDGLAVLKSQLEACESLLYAGSATRGGLPLLDPLPLLDTVNQLVGMLDKVEQAVMDVIKDVNQKKKSLKSDPLLSIERELFVYFFNDPAKLRRALEHVTTRLQAQLVN